MSHFDTIYDSMFNSIDFKQSIANYNKDIQQKFSILFDQFFSCISHSDKKSELLSKFYQKTTTYCDELIELIKSCEQIDSDEQINPSYSKEEITKLAEKMSEKKYFEICLALLIHTLHQ
jgi:hypothetical protein